ncbi:MAG TPA: hypothetical protein VF974_08130 [Patescibacteria group bacterium]
MTEVSFDTNEETISKIAHQLSLDSHEAAFVAHAVNSYEKSMEAMKAALDVIESTCQERGDNCVRCKLMDAIYYRG